MQYIDHQFSLNHENVLDRVLEELEMLLNMDNAMNTQYRRATVVQ